MTDILNYSVPLGEIAVWWLGQSGFLFKTPDGKIIVIDAYLSNSVAKNRADLDRLVPVPIRPGELICDYYICTHNHTDHADPETIRNLNNKESITFIGPRNVVKSYIKWSVPQTNIHLLEAGDQLSFGETRLTGTFCIPNSEAVLDSTGIILQYKDISIYHSGDTGYHPFLGYISKYQVDMAFLCINGKFGNMTYQEAFILSKAINPQYVVPCHFDMFPINREDPDLFRQLFKQKKSMIKCIVPKIGTLLAINNNKK